MEKFRKGLLLLLVLVVLLFTAAKHATDKVAGALDTLGGLGTGRLAAIGDAADGGVGGGGTGDARVGVVALVVLALSLGAGHALLGTEVADRLEETALAELAGGEVVDAVLQVVDLVDASDLGLV